MHRLFLIVSVGVMAILAGCAPSPKKLVVCAGKASLSESLSVLQWRRDKVTGLKALGTCQLRYHVDAKPHRENLRIWIGANPPDEFYLRGDVSIVPKAVVVGSNRDEFWLALRPKEISTYWWGKWSNQQAYQGLAISPKVMLEVLGVTIIDSNDTWSLSNQGPYDVLTQSDAQQKTLRKIYIYSCDYSVRKIEYFGSDGGVVLTAELDKYKKVVEGFLVPTRIMLRRPSDDEKGDWVKITLTSVRKKDFDEKHRKIFQRRPPRGFEHVYVIIDGEPVKLLH